MRALSLALLVVAMVAACATQPSDGTMSRIPLRGADCLDPPSTRSWHEVSSRVILVDAGRRMYRVTLAHQCSLLGARIVFVGDPISGRVCGNYGDAIVVDRGERCAIDRIEVIDRETWNREQNTPKGEASGSVSR